MAKIISKEQAFEQLETTKYGIPFEGIKYLYNHKHDADIESKIIHHLSNAYDEDLMFDRKTGWYSNASLWYGIVAENHMKESLVDPIIDLYTKTDGDWDFLNEQGSYLVGKSCQILGDIAVDKYMDVIEEFALKDSELPYMYLFDCLHFAKESEYKDKVLRILENPELKWIDGLISELGVVNYQSSLPRIRELLKYYEAKKNKTWLENHTIIELQTAIKNLESTDVRTGERLDKSYYEKRGDWQKHYIRMQNRFAKKEPSPVKKTLEKKKTGRNDPCYCGSGKKYKKCCWPN